MTVCGQGWIVGVEGYPLNIFKGRLFRVRRLDFSTVAFHLRRSGYVFGVIYVVAPRLPSLENLIKD